MNTRADYLS